MKQIVLALLVVALAGSGAPAQTKEAPKAPAKPKAPLVVKKKIDGKDGGWLGVMLHQKSDEEGVIVADVIDESPAEEAGIKEDDHIVEFNGAKVTSAEQLTESVRALSPGTKTQVIVQRDGEKKTLAVTIGKQRHDMAWSHFEMPDVPEPPHIRRDIRIVTSGDEQYGMDLMDLGSQLGEYFEVPGGHGVLVEKVKRGSDAEKAGFRAGDVIVKIGKESVTDQDQMSEALDEYNAGEKAEFGVIRKGQRQSFTLEVKKEEEHGHRFRIHSGMFPNGSFNFGPEFGDKMHAFGDRMQAFGDRMRAWGEKVRTEVNTGCCDE